MIMIREKLFYDENDILGCYWGKGGSGEYKLIVSSLDYGRHFLAAWGAGYPMFVGLDIKLP